MRCESIPALLILMDEETLDPFNAWQLRRHLTACPTCAAEHAAFARLDSRLRAADSATGFAPFHSRGTVRPSAPLLRRRVLLAGASAAVVAVFGAAVMFTPSPIAFAQVRQAMASVRTAEWTETETWITDPHVGAARTEATTRVRARMNPPTLLFEMTGRNDNGERFTNISLKTPDEFRTYRVEAHEISLIPYNGLNVSRTVTRKSVAAGLRREILNKLTFTPPDAASAGANKLDWETRKTTLDGKPALQFTFRAAAKLDERERHVFTLWADPQTKRVLRTEQEARDAVTGALTHRQVIENIRCDVPVSDAAFTLNAPAGTPVYHENYWWERSSSVTLTSEEKVRINRLIDETYAGVLASDFPRASAGWDLGYAASLPGSPVPHGGLEAWLRRKVAAGHQYKVMRRSAVSGINDAPYVRVLGFGDATIPAGKSHLVAVTLTPGILYKDNFQEMGTETLYFRRDVRDGFRIVGWQYDEGQRQQWHSQWLKKAKP